MKQLHGSIPKPVVQRMLMDENIRLKKIYEDQLEEKLKETVHRVVNGYTAALLNVLHGQLGFGHKRAKDFVLAVDELFDSIEKDVLSLEECLEYNKKFLGIDIDLKKGWKKDGDPQD